MIAVHVEYYLLIRHELIPVIYKLFCFFIRFNAEPAMNQAICWSL